MVVVIKADPATIGLEPSEARLPGSKSHSQRAMLLAGLSPGRCLLRGLLQAEDTAVLARALNALGANLLATGTGLQIEGAREICESVTLLLGENGTALRTLGAILPMLGQNVILDGMPGLRARPLTPLLSFLDQAAVPHGGHKLPLAIDGRDMPWDKPLEVDASLSTQVASGVMIGLALRQARGLKGNREVLVRRPSAVGYLEVSAQCLRAFGHAVDIHHESDDLRLVLGEQSTQPAQWTIPADASAAAFPLVLRAMGGWRPGSGEPADQHPDLHIRADIDMLMAAAPGAEVILKQCGRRPDCFPALCVLAAMRRGTTQLSGAPALRGKESDRIAVMAKGLSALGIEALEMPDGLIVRGPMDRSPGGDPIQVPAPADHRVVMALALLGSQCKRGICLEHDQAVTKSWPGFWEWLGENADVTVS